MNLTLFIGDVLVGVVVLVIGLILAWSVLSSTADACKIAAGIGSDVLSLVQSEYSVPGVITFNYKGPNICRVNGAPLLMCSPAKGWNPNITSITISPLYFKGTFGFDSQTPVALDAHVVVTWEQSGETKTMPIDIFGLYTYSYSLSNSILLSADSESNSILISKGTSVFGDGDGNLYDPIASTSNGLANVIIQLNNSCKDNNGVVYKEVEYPIPNGYQIAWNDTHICLYQLLLNSGFKKYNGLDFISTVDNGNSKSLRNKFGFVYFVSGYYGSDNNKYIFIENGKNITLTRYYPSQQGEDYYINSTYSDDTLFSDCDSIKYDKNKEEYQCVNPNIVNSGFFYDPYNQGSVSLYHVGWKKLRCIDFSDIGVNLGLSSYSYTFDTDVKHFKASDGMNHILLDFKNYNSIVTWRFNVSYDCSSNEANVTLLGVNS